MSTFILGFRTPLCAYRVTHEVADPHRLLKFGRAGWYSTYLQGNTQVSRKANLRNSNLIVNTATSKLLSIANIHRVQAIFDAHDSPSKSHQNDRSPRTTSCIDYWPLHIGGLGADCKPSCSSYEDGRRAPLLRTVYPSEPILAEASARLTDANGWANPLSALVHYVRGGIVEAGFRGELLTKIVCLMAMDKALSQIPVPEDRWQFSRPITVSDFLDHLVVPLRPEHRTFSEGLKGVPESRTIS